jgi:hypothetical protein
MRKEELRQAPPIAMSFCKGTGHTFKFVTPAWSLFPAYYLPPTVKGENGGLKVPCGRKIFALDCLNACLHEAKNRDVGHCEVRGLPRRYDPRPAHPLTPARKVVIATEAIRKVVESRKREITVTVVPIIRAGTAKVNYDDVLKYELLSIATYK